VATAPPRRARSLRTHLPDPCPRCTGYPTTVHHLVPNSQAPRLFWGALQPRRRLPALQLRRQIRGSGPAPHHAQSP
jgi:hypothetical protein